MQKSKRKHLGQPSTRTLVTVTRAAAETESKPQSSPDAKYGGETYEVRGEYRFYTRKTESVEVVVTGVMGAVMQVFIQKPLGIRFGRGRDGGAYVTRVDKSTGNIDEKIEVMTCQDFSSLDI